MLALIDYEAQLCSGCGGYLPDTTNPEHKFHADNPYRCFRCDAVQKKRADYNSVKQPSALTVWPVRLKR